MADLGSDVSGVTDVDPDGRLVSGRTRLAQAVARRYITPRGRLIGDPNYGSDLTIYVNDDMGPAELAELQAVAKAEALKEEEVLTADVAASLDIDGNLSLVVTLTDADGPFQLLLTINSVTVDLLTVI